MSRRNAILAAITALENDANFSYPIREWAFRLRSGRELRADSVHDSQGYFLLLQGTEGDGFVFVVADEIEAFWPVTEA